jgi:hypothetical protein
MPRQKSAGRAPASRAPARPTTTSSYTTPQQQRPATTMAAPPQHAAPPAQHAPAPQASQGPGLFGQMASTAAGVAVGSSIGHAIGGFFSGGSSEPAPAPQQQVQTSAQQDNQWGAAGNCQGAAQTFTKCLDENDGNMQICNWYLEQLKACQAAAKNY